MELDKIAQTLTGRPQHRLTQAERYVAGLHQPAYTPKEATAEFRGLAKKAIVNMIALSLRSLLQDLSIVSYRHKTAGVGDSVYQAWVRHGMVSGKANLAIRHAAVHGSSYTALLPDLRGRKWTVGVFGPRDVYVEYEDAVNDPRPSVFAARLPGQPGLAAVWWEDKTVSILDIKTRTLIGTGGTSRQFFGDTEPVVRYTAGDWIINGHGDMVPTGEVEPLISAQDRINQAIMDLLLVQTYGAVTLRMISGLVLPGDDASVAARKVKLAIDRLLVADDNDTKLTSAVGTPLEPFIRNADAAIRHFAILSQTPPNRLLGELENIGADAILVARESQESKLTSYREAFGERFEVFARAIAVADGQGDPGPGGYWTWRSTELRTIAEIFDAVSKAGPAGLNVEPLLRRNLTWRPEEIDELLEGYQAQRLAPSPDVAAIVSSVDRQMTPLATVPAAASSADGAPAGATR